MQKFFMGLGAIVLGYGASAGAEALGASFLVSFIIGGIGSIVGIVVGWNIARRLE